jgi:exopolysaccharide biosynthesis polyprenyl glycosylphosphotransferase
VWWADTEREVLVPGWLTVLFVPLTVAIMALQGLYQRRLDNKLINEIGPVETAVAVAAIVWLSVLILVDVPGRPGALAARVWICAAVLLPVGRIVLALVKRELRQRHGLMAPTLIVGNGRVAHQIVERLQGSPEYGLLPVGLLDDESPQSGNDLLPGSSVPYIGSPDSIEGAVEDTGAENIVIAFSRSRDEVLSRVIHVAHRHGLRVWVVPRMFDAIGERARIEHIGGLPLLALSYTNPNGWQFTAKHVSDRVLAGLGLLLISPVFLGLMLLVRLSSPGPIFFRQERVGRDGRVFGCLKFRSMRPPSESDAQFELEAGAAPGGVEGVDRRTKIGKIMRATSLDELPQLINVLKGDMSLVGPRPERPDFVELFEIQIRRYGERHRVKAGVTGWAQVHGLRGQTSIADRAEWDNYYIENWSLGLDLKILALTVAAVLRGSE